MDCNPISANVTIDVGALRVGRLEWHCCAPGDGDNGNDGNNGDNGDNSGGGPKPPIVLPVVPPTSCGCIVKENPADPD
ncbi:MAG: hypothetical protein LBG83_05030 [Oscillospiraceae bacterium]|jgi:hypothetical protein|nr:hypothetical protein [Oscillospiraceae bacterium]